MYAFGILSIKKLVDRTKNCFRFVKKNYFLKWGLKAKILNK